MSPHPFTEIDFLLGRVKEIQDRILALEVRIQELEEKQREKK
jgi:hypothetical protein